MSNNCCNVGFFGSERATELALTNLNKIVTGSGSATATSTISQENADSLASKEAKLVAKVAAETEASLVNIAQDYIFDVSNLNDSGIGSFRNALENNVFTCICYTSYYYV